MANELHPDVQKAVDKFREAIKKQALQDEYNAFSVSDDDLAELLDESNWPYFCRFQAI